MRYAALLLAVGSLSAAPVPKELKKSGDAKAMVGLWVQPRPGGSGVGFQFAADGTLQTWSGPQRGSLSNWTWAVVDQNATPKKARIVRASDPAGQTFDCIYELAGDTLKFALVMRPERGVPAKVEQHESLQFFEMTRDPAGK